MTNTPTETAEDVARHASPPPNHYREATVHLELALESQDDGTRTAHSTLALAHATMLAANEARIANLVGYAAVIRSAPQLTPAGLAKLRLLETRIDSALGTDEIPEVNHA